MTPADLSHLDDAITTAGQALTTAERRLSALAALLRALDALTSAAHAEAVPDESREAVDALPTAPLWLRTRDQIAEAVKEVKRLETVVAAAQQAFRAAEASAR